MFYHSALKKSSGKRTLKFDPRAGLCYNRDMKTLIVAINAKLYHKALAPWCLKSYCDDRGFCDVEVIETNIGENAMDVAGKIYERKAKVVAFSCYIWNIDLVARIGELLKKVMPDAVIVLGGPEVSFCEEDEFPFADYVIRRAGEEAFYNLLATLEAGGSCNTRSCQGDGTLVSHALRATKSASAAFESGTNRNHDYHSSLSFASLPSPFSAAYFDSFSANPLPVGKQLVYYESARGCPFSCSYCLSSTEKNAHVQYLPVERVKKELAALVGHGAKIVKFCDRTYNANTARAKGILEFILSLETDCAFHFEAAGDLFDDKLLKTIQKMPPGRAQFEIGIQSVCEEVLKATGRKTDTVKTFAAAEKLVAFGNCHIHLDLIAGLPGETLNSFAAAVDRCINAGAHVLQLGFLKMLKGSRIRREAMDFGAVFSDFTPYEVLKTNTLSFEDIQKLKRIENVIERFYNSGAFACTLRYAFSLFASPFDFFVRFADYLEQSGQGAEYKSSLKTAYTLLYDFLSGVGARAEILRKGGHYIKLDCLSSDPKGASLPDAVLHARNRELEQEYKKKLGKSAKFRIEYFEFDGRTRLFLYDGEKNFAHRYECREI